MWYYVVVFMLLSTRAYVLLDRSSNRCIESFGTLSLTNNLLGSEVTLSAVFNDAMYACSVCTRPPHLCNESKPSTPLHPMMHIRLLDANNNILDHTHTPLLSIGNDTCHNTLRILIGIEIKLSSFTLHLTPDTPITEPKDKLIICNSTTLYKEIGFDCLKTPLIQPIVYQVENCLISKQTPAVPIVLPTATERHTALYWYLSCLDGTLRSNATLCGEPVCSILYRSNLYLNQCDVRNDTKHREMTAWYQMAVQLIVYRLNYGEEQAYRYVWWLVGVELLERHCYAKQHPLSEDETREYNSFFRQFIRQLDEDNSAAEELPCRQIKHQFDALYNKTMSEMLYNQWYYAAFKFTLMPDRDMEIHAILLICFFCILPFLVFATLGYCVYTLRGKKKWSTAAISRL